MPNDHSALLKLAHQRLRELDAAAGGTLDIYDECLHDKYAFNVIPTVLENFSVADKDNRWVIDVNATAHIVFQIVSALMDQRVLYLAGMLDGDKVGE